MAIERAPASNTGLPCDSRRYSPHMARLPRGSLPLPPDGPDAPEGVRYAQRVHGDLRALRAAGVTYSAIADRSGLTAQAVWEFGYRPGAGVRLWVIDRLASACASIRQELSESLPNSAD